MKVGDGGEGGGGDGAARGRESASGGSDGDGVDGFGGPEGGRRGRWGDRTGEGQREVSWEEGEEETAAEEAVAEEGVVVKEEAADEKAGGVRRLGFLRMATKLPDGSVYSPRPLAWFHSAPYPWQFGSIQIGKRLTGRRSSPVRSGTSAAAGRVAAPPSGVDGQGCGPQAGAAAAGGYEDDSHAANREGGCGGGGADNGEDGPYLAGHSAELGEEMQRDDLQSCDPQYSSQYSIQNGIFLSRSAPLLNSPLVHHPQARRLRPIETEDKAPLNDESEGSSLYQGFRYHGAFSPHSRGAAAAHPGRATFRSFERRAQQLAPLLPREGPHRDALAQSAHLVHPHHPQPPPLPLAHLPPAHSPPAGRPPVHAPTHGFPPSVPRQAVGRQSPLGRQSPPYCANPP